MGFDPRSFLVKCLHLLVGGAWLAAISLFLFRCRGGWVAMLICAVAGLWYLPFGTIISLIVIGLLFVPTVKRQYADVT